MTGAVNTIAAGGAYKFCESQCPTGYAETSSKQCTTSDAYIANINFNIVGINYTNQQTLADSSQDLVITSADYDPDSTTTQPSLYPAKNRGVYFNGDDSNPGYVNISNVHFAPDFSLHLWVMRKSLGQTGIFTKDKNYHLYFFAYISWINTLGTIIDGCNSEAINETVVEDKWYYLVWSIYDDSGNSRQVDTYVNNVNALSY